MELKFHAMLKCKVRLLLTIRTKRCKMNIMDNKGILKLSIMVLFALLIGTYVIGYFMYKDYSEKTAYLNDQAQLATDRFKEMEDGMRDIDVVLSNATDENKIEIRKMLSQLDSMQGILKDWETEYNKTVSDLKGEISDLKVSRLRRRMEKLQDEIDGFKMAMQDWDLKIYDDNRALTYKEGIEGVDLGKISVKKKSDGKREQERETKKK